MYSPYQAFTTCLLFHQESTSIESIQNVRYRLRTTVLTPLALVCLEYLHFDESLTKVNFVCGCHTSDSLVDAHFRSF